MVKPYCRAWRIVCVEQTLKSMSVLIKDKNAVLWFLTLFSHMGWELNSRQASSSYVSSISFQNSNVRKYYKKPPETLQAKHFLAIETNYTKLKSKYMHIIITINLPYLIYQRK